MPHRLKQLKESAGTWQLFATVLFLVFSIETGVMLMLPRLLPGASDTYIYAFFDAGLLTVTLAPVLWQIVVKPLKSLTEARRILLAKLLESQEDERGKIARDLHDGLGQSLTSLLVGLRAVEESSSDVALIEKIRKLRKIGSTAHDEIRRMARGLRPVVLDDIGLEAALERLTGEFGSLHGVEVQFESIGFNSHRLPRRNETTIYRIAQEAVTNAIRHGSASKILVKIVLTETKVSVEVRDDGQGFNPESVMGSRQGGISFGLLSMEERARMSDGDLTVVSQPGSGTSIKAEFPIKNGGAS